MNATLLGRGLAAATLACALGAAAPSGALAQAAPATVRVVHGIPGRDIGPTVDPQLPVDVLVNKSICVLKGFAFGSVSAPLSLPAGTYEIQVSLANPVTPCANAAVIDQNVTLAAGEEAAAVAALSTAGKPVLDAFAIDLAAITKAGGGRVVVAHAALAPPVAVALDGKTALASLHPGKEAVAALPAKTYQVSVSANSKTLFGPAPLTVQVSGVTLVFAVGAAGKGTFTLVTATIPGVV